MPTQKQLFVHMHQKASNIIQGWVEAHSCGRLDSSLLNGLYMHMQ